MKIYETEYKGTFITVSFGTEGLDAVLTYPECSWNIEAVKNVDELFSLVFKGFEAGKTIAQSIRETSAVIMTAKTLVTA
jgi:hypothetical protein